MNTGVADTKSIYKINCIYTLAMNHWKDKVWKNAFTIALKK